MRLTDNARRERAIPTIVQDLLAEEHDLLLALGLDFLEERQAEVAARIERQESLVRMLEAEGDPLARTHRETLQNLYVEQELLASLTEASATRPFAAVHREYLHNARRRMQRLLMTGPWTPDPSLRAQRRQARLEQELLIELWSKWHVWVQPRTLRNTKP
ncbi:MAG: hypothetical protein AB1435_02895 [Chloroflexota bacterium]|jgi:uncharacterized protein YciI